MVETLNWRPWVLFRNFAQHFIMEIITEIQLKFMEPVALRYTGDGVFGHHGPNFSRQSASLRININSVLLIVISCTERCWLVYCKYQWRAPHHGLACSISGTHWHIDFLPFSGYCSWCVARLRFLKSSASNTTVGQEKTVFAN
jgi:hypothetical protein